MVTQKEKTKTYYVDLLTKEGKKTDEFLVVTVSRRKKNEFVKMRNEIDNVNKAESVSNFDDEEITEVRRVRPRSVGEYCLKPTELEIINL